MSESSKEVLSLKERVHQDWFDENSEEINTLLQEKHKAYIEWQNDESKRDNFKRFQSKVQRELQYMEDNRWDQKAKEVQQYADTNNHKAFFSSLEAAYGPSTP